MSDGLEGMLFWRIRQLEDVLQEMLGSYTVKERIRLLALWNQSLRLYIPGVEPEGGHLASLHAFIGMLIEALCKLEEEGQDGG